MPQLKQLSCCLQWSDTNAPFQEHGTVYGDGVVEAFVVVPNRPCTFTIRLKSHGFIHGGLAMIVFIDGNYQCNRSRVNLRPAVKDKSAGNTEIDFLLRQKEKPHGDGIYMGRQWRFDNHNIVADPIEGHKGHFDELGTIEVIVLRCNALYDEDAEYDGSSSGEDSDIFGERLRQEGLEREATATSYTNGKDEIATKSTAVEAAIEDDVGGLFGLFDGPSDAYGPYQTHGGRWVWHPQGTSSDGFTYTSSNGTPPYPPHGAHFHVPSHNSPSRNPYQWHGRYGPNFPHQSERHVHWDLGPGSNSSSQSYPNNFHGSTFNHPPPPQRPQSRERVRSSSQTLTGPPYAPQQMYRAQQMYPPQQTSHPQQMNHAQQLNPSQQMHPPQQTNTQQHSNLPQQMHPPQQMNPAHQTNPPQRMNPSQQSNATSYYPHRASLSQQYQAWHPGQSHLPGPMGIGYVSENTNQTQSQPHAEPFVPENPANPQASQAYPAWQPEADLARQDNIGVTPSAAQSGEFHTSAPDANSQQFGNQANHFLPSLSQPWPLGSQRNASYVPQQMSSSQPHYAPWPTLMHNMQAQPHVHLPHPQYFPPHAQSIPHVINHQPANGYFPRPSFSVQPTEGISPGNTMFNQTTQAMDMNTGGNSWQSNNAGVPIHNGNDNETGAWNVQENIDGNNNQDWNTENQTEGNEANNDWNNNDLNGQNNDNNNNNAWQSNNNNNNVNDNSGWENAAANQASDTWGNGVNATQANGAGDNWGAGDNDNNHQAQTGEPTYAFIANMARDLYGPHGPYYSYRILTADEPKPDAEEEPRFDVPQSIATERGSTKQVQPGPGYQYHKKCLKPEYVDSMEFPYARFVFKYRTKEQLQNEIGIEVDVEPSSDQAITELQGLDKQTLVKMLMRAKGALGGKVPSPPLTPADANGAEVTKPIALPAPVFPYLRYSLPPLRPLNSNVDKKASKSAEDLQNNQNTTNWDAANNNAGNSWADNNANTQNWGGAQNQGDNTNWGAVNAPADNGWATNNTNTNNQNWGGASGWDSAREGDRKPSTSTQQQQQRPSVQFSVHSLNNEQAADGRNASVSTGQPTMQPTLLQQQNDPNNEQHFIPKPPTPDMDNWDSADAVNSQTGWV